MQRLDLTRRNYEVGSLKFIESSEVQKEKIIYDVVIHLEKNIEQHLR